MRIIDRYLTTLFLRQLGLILATLVGLYGLIEFVERVDNFIEQQASWLQYLRYPLYKLPLMATQTLPMALLLAAFATVGHLSRTQQLTALRSGGISFWQATRPLFLCGALFSLLMLVANSWVVPWSNRESRYILHTELSEHRDSGQQNRDLYLRDGQLILCVDQSFPHRGEIQGLTLLDLDPHFNLQRRLEAASAHYVTGHRWRLQGVTEHLFDPDTHAISGFAKRDEMLFDLGYGPHELSEIWAEPEELSLPELAAFAEQLRRQGQNPRRYEIEQHVRGAQSLMPLIVILLGVPFALQRGRQATLGVGVALSLGIFVVYILLQAIGMALGSAGLLPLPLAAWSANLLLLLVGSWLFLTRDS